MNKSFRPVSKIVLQVASIGAQKHDFVEEWHVLVCKVKAMLYMPAQNYASYERLSATMSILNAILLTFDSV